MEKIDIVEEEIVSWRRLLNRRDREIAELRRMLGVALFSKSKARTEPKRPAALADVPPLAHGAGI